MLEDHSDRTRRVLAAAADEARRLGHARVGTEHVLLGLLAQRDGQAVVVLRAGGATLEAARPKVGEVVVSTGEPPDGELPFTPRAQRALERAARFSRHARRPEVDAEHVLLGVLDVEGLACQVLRGLGVDVAHLRDDLVSDAPDPEPAPSAAVSPSCPACGGAIDGVVASEVVEARTAAGATGSVLLICCRSCGAVLGTQRP